MFASVAMINTITINSFRGHLAYRLESLIEGNSERILEPETETDFGEMFLVPFAFLTQLRHICLGMIPPTVGWARLHPLAIKENASYTHLFSRVYNTGSQPVCCGPFTGVSRPSENR